MIDTSTPVMTAGSIASPKPSNSLGLILPSTVAQPEPEKRGGSNGKGSEEKDKQTDDEDVEVDLSAAEEPKKGKDIEHLDVSNDPRLFSNRRKSFILL